MTALVPKYFSPSSPPRLAPRRENPSIRVTGGGATIQSGARGVVGGTPFQTVTTGPAPAPGELVGPPGWNGYGRTGCGWWGCGGYYPWYGPWMPFGYPIAALPGPWVVTSPYGWAPPTWTPAAWGPYPFGYDAAWSWY